MRRLAWYGPALLLLGMGAGAAAGPAAAQGPFDEIRRVVSSLPADFLTLTDLDVVTGGDGTITATAATTLLGSRTDVLIALSRGAGRRGYRLALRPDDWSLARAVPQLANPALEDLRLSNVGLVIASDAETKSSDEMEDAEYQLYREILGADRFVLTLRPGINLFASIPVDRLPSGHPLLGVMNALGIERGTVRLQGSLGKSLTLLSQPGAGGASAIRDLYLRAELPPMRPPGSPEWFRSGQLALEITGDPSVRLVGDMRVRIQDDEPLFFLAAALARTGMSLAGGLRAEEGWRAPFGIEWMTLNKVVLKLGITPTGSVQLGFAGDLVVGQKDMAVAVAIAVSPAGVPTNFIFAGESEAGFGLSDLLELQARMAAVRAAGGASGPLANATIPADALPPVEFRGVALKFAPRPEPDLGVERGMAIKGRLLLPTGPGGALADVAAVDVSVGDDGVRANGRLAAFRAGPLVWQDAVLDLVAGGQEQRLRISGDVQLFTARQKLDLDLTRTSLRFQTVSELYGRIRAQIDATAAFDLRQPNFAVHAVMESELAEALDPVVRGGATVFVQTSRIIVEQADAVIGNLRIALARADATSADLRAALEGQRAAVAASVLSAETVAAELLRATRTAAAERDRAYALWNGTPIREVALKASRRVAWVREAAEYSAIAARYAGQLAAVAATKRILAALPPVDQNVALLAAGAAAAAIRTQLEAAERNLAGLRQRYETVAGALAQGGVLFAIDRAEVDANLEGLRSGEALQWRLTGRFVNAPFDITETLDFRDLPGVGGAVLARLIDR